MNKAFVRENDGADDEEDAPDPAAALPAGSKNYITPQGFARLQAELRQLLGHERPQLVETVHWAAKNGDRSENGDYLYGKKRLREVDRRIRFLTRRLEMASVVDASAHAGSEQIFFGASVTYADAEDADAPAQRMTIVGVDEADGARGQVSWVSPIARALLKARVGDEVPLPTPAGLRTLLVLAVDYPQKAP